MRQKIVAGNWKMHKTYQDGLALAAELLPMLADELHGDAQVVLAVPYIHIHAVARLAAGNPAVHIAAQNCHQEVQGAYTGEVAAAQLASAGASHVLLGHSERRQYFGEGAALLLAKVQAALAAGLTPIYCCGETQDIREAGSQDVYVGSQIAQVLFALSPTDMAKVVIAYEPIWAIGTGLTASPAQAQAMHAAIRAQLATHFGQPLADATPILYGGSVKASNAAELFAQPDIDGALVGGASLQSREFANIAKAL